MRRGSGIDSCGHGAGNRVLQGRLVNAAGTQRTMSAAVHRTVCACFLYGAGLIYGTLPLKDNRTVAEFNIYKMIL